MVGKVQAVGRMLTLRSIVVVAALLSLAGPAAAMAPSPRSFDPPRPTPSPRLTGYGIPVDAPLVLAFGTLPGAPREYRAGTHEGIDIAAPFGAPVRAARAGTIARIDHAYVEWSFAQRAFALATAVHAGAAPPDLLDRIRGRQVWIDHGDGVVTRYAHLSAVATELEVGDSVDAGALIGNVGASGLPEGGSHLHFEIRVGTGYLGEGLDSEDVRYLVARAFSPDVVKRERESTAR